MDKNGLVDGLGSLAFGMLFIYLLWYLLIGLLYVAALIYAVSYAAVTTLILPYLTGLSVAIWRFFLIRFGKRHTHQP